MLSKTIVIALEGGEMVGKTTTTKALAKRLEELGISVKIFREPGGDDISNDIREVILKDRAIPYMDSMVEGFLYAAARRQNILANIIQPYLDEVYDVMIIDRTYLTSVIYQGLINSSLVEEPGYSYYFRDEMTQWIKNINKDALTFMNKDISRRFIFHPDFFFILTLSPEVALERMRAPENKNRFDKMHLEFHQRVHEYYSSIVNDDGILMKDKLFIMPTRNTLHQFNNYPTVSRLDASESTEELVSTIFETVKYKLNKERGIKNEII